MQNTALFIGRFQPFHNGHLDAIKQILNQKEIDNMIIVIGSAENDFLPDCPFTAGERFQMIWLALEEAKVSREKYFIVPIRNIDRYSLWSTHLKRLLPEFQYVFSGSKLIQNLFKTFENKIDFKILKKNIKLCATNVREAMIFDKNWKSMVPSSVAAYLVKIKASERLKDICVK